MPHGWQPKLEQSYRHEKKDNISHSFPQESELFHFSIQTNFPLLLDFFLHRARRSSEGRNEYVRVPSVFFALLYLIVKWTLFAKIGRRPIPNSPSLNSFVSIVDNFIDSREKENLRMHTSYAFPCNLVCKNRSNNLKSSASYRITFISASSNRIRLNV